MGDRGLGYLDQDFFLELGRRRKLVGIDINRLGQEHLTEDLLEVGRHVPLLDDAAVVFDGQDDGIPGGGKEGRVIRKDPENPGFPVYL